MQTNFDKELLDYFTNVEHLRDAFKASVAAPTLTKRLLVIHGVAAWVNRRFYECLACAVKACVSLLRLHRAMTRNPHLMC